MNHAGLTGHYEAVGHPGKRILLETARSHSSGEFVDLRDAIAINRQFCK